MANSNDQFLDFLVSASKNLTPAATSKAVVETLEDEYGVPSRLVLTDTLKASLPELIRAPLIPLAFDHENETIDSSQAPTNFANILKSVNDRPTLCLVLRRPGCCFCREDGMELTKLEKKENINLVGIVKDLKDYQGLRVFHKDYFSFPIFRDVDLQTVKSLGNRSVGWSVLKLYFGPHQRVVKKGIQFNMKRWLDAVQGGVLIFDRNGDLRYAFHEMYGDELCANDICLALEAVRKVDAHGVAYKSS